MHRDKRVIADNAPKRDATEAEQSHARLAQRLARIRHKILVLSGKGGVGKSTVSVNLALVLAQAGRTVGLLDVDVHGPSIPTLLGLAQERAQSHDDAILPVEVGTLKVMSLGFLLADEREAVIWRGPMKTTAIRQLMADVEWGDLDYLVVDAPPGTGDEPLSVCQFVGASARAVIVTTPQEVALASVRKSVTFCGRVGMPVLGVVENMSGFTCPHCGKAVDILGSGGGERLAREMGLPFLGRIPLDPAVAASGEEGRPLVVHGPRTAATEALEALAASVLLLNGEPVTPNE